MQHVRGEDERDRVARNGTAAWKRLKTGKSWTDWLTVGEAMQVGREWALHQASTNRPEGKAYNMAFGEWLQKYKLDDMDKGDRSRLFSCMDNIGAIEEWRRVLTMTERLKLNHPNAVLRKWKASVAPEPRTEDGEPKPTLRDSVANLAEQLHEREREVGQLKAHIAELEQARQEPPADEQTVETKTEPYTPEFPKYPPSAPGIEDITALVVQQWLEQELLADRISPLSLHMIGKNAQYLAKLWMPKSGRGRLKSKKDR